MINKNELVEYLKIFISQLNDLNHINKLLPFYEYKHLFDIIDDEVIEQLTEDERNICLWFSLECGCRIKLENKEYLFNFLKEIDFKLEEDNCFKPFPDYCIYTSKLINWIKLNLEKEDVSAVLNKALRNTEKVDKYFDVFDLIYLDLDGQEYRFDINNLIRDFYDDFNDRYKDFNFEYPESTLYFKLQQILFKDERLKEGIGKFIELSANEYSYNAFMLLSYGNKYQKQDINYFYVILNYLTLEDWFLMSANESLMNELKSLKGLNFLMGHLYENLYLNLEEKEAFDKLFKNSLKEDNAFILAEYPYLKSSLTKNEINIYLNKFKKIKDPVKKALILNKMLSPLELLKIKTILSQSNIEKIESFNSFALEQEDINLLQFGLTDDLKIPDESLKILKMNYSV